MLTRSITISTMSRSMSKIQTLSILTTLLTFMQLNNTKMFIMASFARPYKLFERHKLNWITTTIFNIIITRFRSIYRRTPIGFGHQIMLLVYKTMVFTLLTYRICDFHTKNTCTYSTNTFYTMLRLITLLLCRKIWFTTISGSAVRFLF